MATADIGDWLDYELATANGQGWLEDHMNPYREMKEDRNTTRHSLGDTIPPNPILTQRDSLGDTIPPNPILTQKDERTMRNLEKEIEGLERTIQSMWTHINQEKKQVKPLLKPRDIPVLELRHLSGVEGAGRLGVFLSQVENCSQDTQERQQIVNMRVDASLAMFVQNVLRRGYMSWGEFKLHLTSELTDQSEERILDCLNDFNYTCDEDPIEFVSHLKCKLALLEVNSGEDDVPNRERLIKKKLIKGMPKESRDRLELYMDPNMSLRKFLRKLNTERLVVMSHRREKVNVVEPPRLFHEPRQNWSAPNRTQGQANSNRKREQPRQWPQRNRYCPYCRASNHTVAECYRKPRPGSCYDCLRMGCRQGQPGCPGRVHMMRGRLI